MKESFFLNPYVWIFITAAGFGLCALLPLGIKNDSLRRKVNWIILIPVSLILILYTYPVGLEMFRRWAVGFSP